MEKEALMRIAIIGGGAAGFFAALTAKENYTEARVSIFEKSATVLSKVKLSGGGRCNVTNGVSQISALIKAYPRGANSLKKLFYQFSNLDALQWFESRGVPLVTQEDGCVFPEAQDSQAIIDCFLREAHRLEVEIHRSSGVSELRQVKEKWALSFHKDKSPSVIFDKVIVTTGGSPRKEGLQWLMELGHRIELPVPSLFTFNLPQSPISRLMGLVVEDVKVGVEGSRFSSEGSLLITHWGMSGPAVLKLSSYAARYLHQQNYDFRIHINWVGIGNPEMVSARLQEIVTNHPGKQVTNYRPFALPERLWIFLIEKSGISTEKKWAQIGKKGVNKLVDTLTHDVYPVKGKSTFRDEFVTCGGVSLKDVNMKTMQSKVSPNLYFAGEVLDIDAITGGYNLQAAWTTGYVAGHLRQ